MNQVVLNKRLQNLATASLVMLLLVMLAGSVVRMSGSGMGCPDWPKCFGYLIPPTDVNTLTWSPDREFRRGQMILYNGAFYVAKQDLRAGNVINMDFWDKYTKHDYNVFNPIHTWVEFINRLLGALSGLPVLAFFLLSLLHIRKHPLHTILGALSVFLLGFVAWLGKRVVDGNLVPHSITYHMFSALALVAIFSFLAVKLRTPSFAFHTRRDKRIIWLGLGCLVILLLQIALGTEVREQVDAIARGGEADRSLWVDLLGLIFKVHRSFSLLALSLIGIFAFWIIRTRTVSTWPRVLLGVVAFEILAGMGLAYLGMPALLQPLHLMLAVITFVLLIAILVSYHQRTIPR